MKRQIKSQQVINMKFRDLINPKKGSSQEEQDRKKQMGKLQHW